MISFLQWGICCAPEMEFLGVLYREALPPSPMPYHFIYRQLLREKSPLLYNLLINLQIQHENNFLPTIKHWQAKVRRFLGICLYDFFVNHSNFVYQKCLKARRHLGFGHKTVNSQGYSGLWEPIKMCTDLCTIHWFGKY